MSLRGARLTHASAACQSRAEMMRRLFAALYDTIGKSSEAAGLREERRQLLAGAEGDVIELGAGTGLNLDLYTEQVTRLVLTEPDQHMRRRLQRRLDARPAGGDRRCLVREPALP